MKPSYILLLSISLLIWSGCELFKSTDSTTDIDPPVVVENPDDDSPTAEEPNYPIGNASITEWIHRPLHPDNNQSVQFTIKAKEPKGATKVVLSIYEYEWYRNEADLPSKRRRQNGQWGKVKTWNFATPTKTINLGYTYTDGFPAGTNVEYVFHIYSIDGKRSEALALFDAGTSLWPDDKIMLYATSRQHLDQCVNLCFVPDTDYGASANPVNWTQFLGDVEALIYDGYHKNNMVKNHKENWAFFYTREEVDGLALALDYVNEDKYPSFMKDHIIDGIDAFGILHINEYSDGAYLLGNLQFLAKNVFTSESYNHGTAIHETGHAIFNLSDEYNGCVCFESNNGMGANVFTRLADCRKFNLEKGYDIPCTLLEGWNGLPWYMSERNVYFPTLEQCQQFNESQGYPLETCITFQDIDGQISYRSNSGLCIMQDDGDDIVRPFQQTCGGLIREYYDLLEASTAVFVPLEKQDNFYGYEQTVLLEVENQGTSWNIVPKEVRYGIPAKNQVNSDAYTLAIKSRDGQVSYATGLDQPNRLKIEGASRKKNETVETKSDKFLISIPYNTKIENLELYDNQPPRARSGGMIVKGTGLVKRFPEVADKIKTMKMGN